MRVYRIISDRSKVPLAEVREEGGRVDFIVDNTRGSLPKVVGGKFDKLVQIVRSSSHLSLMEPQEATTHLLRYVLTNGDVVEITTDGKTAVLNGRLLSPEERNALFSAIKNGELGIARKADLAAPHPVLPPLQSFTKPSTGDFGDKIREVMMKRMENEQKKKADSSVDYDHSIEESDYRGLEDPNWTKQFMYYLKYGAARGQRK